MKKQAIKKAQKQEKILEIKVSSTSKQRVINFVREHIANHKKFYIVTPNPEIIVQAQADTKLKEIINRADLSLPDGIGIAAASKFQKLPRPKKLLTRILVLFAQGLGVGFSILFDRKWLTQDLEIIKGREIFIELIEFSNKRSWKVVLIGDKRQSAQKAKEKLQLNYKKVDITASDGPDLNNNGEPLTKNDELLDQKLVKKINQVKPKLIFIGFGAPKQEKWLNKHFDNLDIGGAMMVGGTFDYVSGKVKLPPQWISESGLEWLWRLFIGSQKPKRIYNAVLKFAAEVFFNKLYGN